MEKPKILLDMDGVLSDFFTSAVKNLNQATGKNITIPEYVSYNTFDMEKIWGISVEDFWKFADNSETFWEDISPYPWYKEIYSYLTNFGEVTLATSPAPHNVSCATQKAKWVKKYLGLDNHSMMIGSRKYLMANPNTILVDDYHKNIEKFSNAGGKTCLIRSNWNTLDINFDIIKQDLDKVFLNL